MRLYLVQHGEAVAKEIDPDRPLSEEGGRDIQQLGAWFAKRGVQVSRVLHSGKTRARQTAESLAVAIAPDLAVEAVSGMAPKDPVAPFLARVGDWAGDTLAVGHQPFMGRLVSALLNCGDRNVVAYRPGTLVCLESDQTEDWLLVWVVRPESYKS